MTFALWLAFATGSFVIAIIPGPSVASIVGFAFSAGRRVAMSAVAGVAAGNIVAMSVSLAGAGAVLAASATAFTALKWIGAAYLIGFGLYAVVTSAGGEGSRSPQRRNIGAGTAFLTSLMIGTFHPKTIIFFVAYAAQFIRPDRPFVSQAAILVVTFTVIAAVTDSFYALAASQAEGLIRREGVRRWAQRIGGAAFICAGVATAAVRR